MKRESHNKPIMLDYVLLDIRYAGGEAHKESSNLFIG
jgi:hypothetical protein